MRAIWIVAGVLSYGVACNSGGPTCGPGTAEVDGVCEVTDTDTTGGADTDGGLSFVRFGANAEDLTAGESVVFSAVLVDRDGVGDIVGGTLETGGGKIYGAFSTGGEESSYQLALAWDTVNQTRAITFEDSEDRDFIAHFFDQDGNEAESDPWTLHLYCEASTDVACGGACTDLVSDNANCGSCGRRCDDLFGNGYCGGGTCRGQSACAPTAGLGAETCESVCAAMGAKCDGTLSHLAYLDGACGIARTSSSSCTQTIAGWATASNGSYRCNCYVE